MATRTEVQAHGFSWEKELMRNVYGATQEELDQIGYTNKMDLPFSLNRLGSYDVSVKTTCKANSVCMADCLRVFDAVSSGSRIHMAVITYTQHDEISKRVQSILEVDLTNSKEALFGTLTRSQIEELVALVKAVPQKRSPTEEEYNRMYALRNSLQPLSAAIHLDIKCNSQQSRLQCSFNKFQEFLKKNPERIIAHSTDNVFRGGSITREIPSGRRTFNRVVQQE